MRALVALVLVSLGAAAQPAVHPGGESTRTAAEYFVQKAGAVWVYEADKKTKGRLTITSFVEWKAAYSFSLGKKSASGTWRIKDNALTERSASRGEGELILLPAQLSRSTTWKAPASMERGTKTPAQYEVISLDAVVELPNGITVDHCLAVLETDLDGSNPHTHYYAPNVGKVAVRAPNDWLYRLVEFRPGHRGHSE